VTRLKRSTLAGTWYEGEASRLRDQVDALLRHAAAARRRVPSPIGIVVPHAGYIYSGRAAAAGYLSLRGTDYERAVILAPSHFASFCGVAVLDIDAFETPLGQLPVDRAAVALLTKQPSFRDDPLPFREEHALEIQLPFLQRVLPDIRVVPALLGDVPNADQPRIAAVLRELADARTVFIVSSDFAHYGWRFGYLPFAAAGPEPVRQGLRRLDMGAIELVCAGDASGFRQYVGRTGATICGRVPISVWLTLHERRTPGELLEYYTSLDVTGDYEHCVSYASIGFPRDA